MIYFYARAAKYEQSSVFFRRRLPDRAVVLDKWDIVDPCRCSIYAATGARGEIYMSMS